MKPVIERKRPVIMRHPLRCWQHLRLPGSVRRDALLELAAIAHERAVAMDPSPGDPPGKIIDVFLLDGAGLTAARWRSMAAGVSIGDGLALLSLSRALLADRRFGFEPAVDPALTALRLAIHHGNRDERRIAAAEMLLALPQVLDQPVLSPTARGRVVVVEQLVYRALLQACRHDGSAADHVADLVTAWVQVTADAVRRGYPLPRVDLGTVAESHAALLAALNKGDGDPSRDGQETAVQPGRPWPGRPGAGRGPMSLVFPDDALGGQELDQTAPALPSMTPFPGYDPAWTSDSRKVLVARYAGLGEPMRLVLAPDRHTADEVLARLRGEMPNFGSAVDRVADHLCLARRLSPSPVLRLPPLLLLGPPGIGKTRFARRLAELLGMPFAWKGLGGASDNRDLAGTARGWSSAQPSWTVTQLVQLGVANPLLLVDEVDKTGGSAHNGRATDTLLTLLEPGTSGRFEDECIGGPIDLSAVSWVLTANDVSGLSAPLLSRLAIVRCGPPLPHQVAGMVGTMLAEIARDYGLADARLLPAIDPILIEQLDADYARHADPRRTRRGLVRALGLAARLEEETGHEGTPTLH